MTTQIEFYDKDVIKNTLGVLTMKPDKVIYIYDEELKDLNRFHSLEKCFKKHLPDIIVDQHPININDMEGMFRTTCSVIDDNGDCIINLTGGSELMIIAGYRAGMEKNAQLIYTDIIKETVLDLKSNSVLSKTAELTLEDFIDARGAELIGNTHTQPEEKEYDRILSMCRYLFRNIGKWKKTCTFLQVAMSNSAPTDLDLRIQTEIRQKDGQRLSPDEKMLYEFQKHGFIKDLYFSGKYIVLSFVSKKYKSYMISYGVWLELFVYIHAVKTGEFKDVKLGTMIDWDAYDGITVAGNEIDVILQEDSIPIFISCKLRGLDTASLNELLIAKRRVGGWFSKSVLVSFGNDKSMKTGTYKRAKELGIEIMDKTDVLSDDFGARLVRTIKGHDLITLKWKKV